MRWFKRKSKFMRLPIVSGSNNYDVFVRRDAIVAFSDDTKGRDYTHVVVMGSSYVYAVDMPFEKFVTLLNKYDR